jgi:capsular exopolysaccharide synthesis family protein
LPLSRSPNPETLLKDTIAGKRIAAGVIPHTEIIALTMRSPQVEEAKIIVDCFIRNYIDQAKREAQGTGREDLQTLEKMRDGLKVKILDQRKIINKAAESLKTTTPGLLEKMNLDVQTRLMTELINLESQKVATEADVNLMAETKKVDVAPEEKIRRRREYVNSDPMVSEWSKSIVVMERELEMQKVIVKDNYPKLVQQQAALENLKAKLKTKTEELGKEFDDGLQALEEEAAKLRLASAQRELDVINARYEALSKRIHLEDANQVNMVRASMDVDDRKFQLQVDQDDYERLSRRVNVLDLEQERPTRVKEFYWADVIETNDRRPQLAIAAFFGALACGFGLALLRDRMDKTLQTPEDVTRQIDLPVLGTTTSSRAIKPALLAEQMAGDYQTIRTNLGLVYDGGLPRRLVVSSAGTREGKTTFAVNLATSLAKSGKKVLLIDGDLRKPDVGQMLNVPPEAGYLQDALLGGDASRLVYVSPTSGLHILAASPRHLADPYELLTSSMAAEQIERLSREYDHVVIDSPPALAFPDALVWAKLADAVVLVSFAGHTTGPDLKEAKERFARGRARVLGAILSNVPLEQGLYRHAYTYRTRAAQSGRRARKLLLATENKKAGDNGGPA